MSPKTLFCCLFWGLIISLNPPAAFCAESAAGPGRAADLGVRRVSKDHVLYLRINIPPAWLILGDENMAAGLADRISRPIIQGGFEVRNLALTDDAGSQANLLTIDLTTWSLDAQGNVHATLKAQLRTPQATTELGPYSSSTMIWAQDAPPFRLSSAFAAATEMAITSLVGDLAKLTTVAGPRTES